MAKYKIVSKVKMTEDDDDYDDFDDEEFPSLDHGVVDCDEVYPEEAGFSNTGLVDMHGNPICRREYKPQCGFLWHDSEGSLRPKHLFMDDYLSKKTWVTEESEKELNLRTPLHERKSPAEVIASPEIANAIKLWHMVTGTDLIKEHLTEEQIAEALGLEKEEEENGSE